MFQNCEGRSAGCRTFTTQLCDIEKRIGDIRRQLYEVERTLSLVQTEGPHRSWNRSWSIEHNRQKPIDRSFSWLIIFRVSHTWCATLLSSSSCCPVASQSGVSHQSPEQWNLLCSFAAKAVSSNLKYRIHLLLIGHKNRTGQIILWF